MPSKKSTSERKPVSKGRVKSTPAKTGEKSTGQVVYQIKITLEDLKPPVWRRVQVKDCSLATLHYIIQICMGWDDSHLHLFEIGGEQYGVKDAGEWSGGWEDPDIRDSGRVKLGKLTAQGVKKFEYVYDMGDNWSHVIQLEKTLPAEAGVAYPRCIEGKRACPPDDCGGPWGYCNMLEALADPKHPEHKHMVEWIGAPFDPEAFDLVNINTVLRRVK